MNVLIFTKTTGYRHSSIEFAVARLVEELGDLGINADHTEDEQTFRPDSLSRYEGVVWLNTTGEVLDDEGRAAYEAFVRAGGAWIGVHGATITEPNWPFYQELSGAYFAGHPEGEHEATVQIEILSHPTMAGIPFLWKFKDEWYDFVENPRSKKVTVLATVDEKSYPGGGMGEDHPIIWCHEKFGGKAWYTGLGHLAEAYEDEFFMNHLILGIRWAINV